MIKHHKILWKKEKKRDIFNMDKQIVRISIAGSVDDGKSTLLGRMLFDLKNLTQDDIDKIKKITNIENEIDFSLFTDGLKDEIIQGITIDVAYRYLSTEKRKYIISDTPGHVQYTRNMITGSSLSNIMLVLIDVKKGLTSQTKRHLFISSLLNVNHIIVCVNKVDLVDYDELNFNKIKKQIEDFSSKLVIKDFTYIPISALKGDNLIERSNNLIWYKGPTLLHCLENIHISSDKNNVLGRIFVQNIIRDDQNNRHIQGAIQSGLFRTNEEIVVYPSKNRTSIKKILNGDKTINTSFAPMSVSMLVNDDIDISRGDLITKSNSLPREGSEIEAFICWLSEVKIDLNKIYKCIRLSSETRCKFSEILYVYNIETLKRIKDITDIELNTIFKAKIKFPTKIYFDSYYENKLTGSFILVDENNNTVCCGMLI